MNPGAYLPNQYAAGRYPVAAVSFNAASLAVTVTAVSMNCRLLFYVP